MGPDSKIIKTVKRSIYVLFCLFPCFPHSKEDSYRCECRTVFHTGTQGRPERVFRNGMKTPNKLIQKLLVSNKFYSDIIWQPE